MNKLLNLEVVPVDKWYRNCPKCGRRIEYTNKRSWYNAKANHSQCKECQRKQLSEYWTGRKRLNYPKHRKINKGKTEWSRKCPDCKKNLYYSSNWHIKEAIRKNTLCGSCSSKKYPRGLAFGLTEDSIKQMRATKSGFSDWQEYKEKYPLKKQYQQEVRRLTRLVDVSDLINSDKLRGLCGEDGVYQLDHKVSIEEGWKNQILPEVIASKDNLQIIKWEENRQKGKIDKTKHHLT